MDPSPGNGIANGDCSPPFLSPDDDDEVRRHRRSPRFLEAPRPRGRSRPSQAPREPTSWSLFCLRGVLTANSTVTSPGSSVEPSTPPECSSASLDDLPLSGPSYRRAEQDHPSISTVRLPSSGSPARHRELSSVDFCSPASVTNPMTDVGRRGDSVD